MGRFAGVVALAASLFVLAAFAEGDSRRAAADGPVRARFAPTIAALGANQSANWSGYNQGLLEKGGSGFHRVSGQWTVPTATQHKAGEAEASATWVGIGGGCLDADCLVVDNTLIQAGTEQDVDASGHASYGTWWEIIPLPQIVADLPVSAGHRVRVDIDEILPALWTIRIENLTTGASFSTTVPYASSYATAEWIEESPLVISTDGGAGVAALPNLTRVQFSAATANGANPGLVSSEAIQMVDGATGAVLATPSAPSGGNAFSVCAYSASC